MIRSHVFYPLYYQGLKSLKRQLEEPHYLLAQTMFFVSFRGTPEVIQVLYGVTSKTRLAKPTQALALGRILQVGFEPTTVRLEGGCSVP